MKRKFMKATFAFVIVFTMAFTMISPVAATDAVNMTAAEKLAHIGVLLGAGQGVTDEYLAMATTRAQGAVVLLRLMGKEDEAKAFLGTDNFTDIVGNEWFTPYTAYLKANPELGFIGYPDGSFKPNHIITGAEMLKVLLTVLGYMQDDDYTWAEVEEFAAELGLSAIADGSAGLDNDTMAKAIWEILSLNKKGTDTTLAQFLIAEGVIGAADANAVGLVTELAIVSAMATNNDEITIKFSASVPEDWNAVVKSGFITIFTTATWNADRTQVILKKSTPFVAGTYQVTVGELAAVNVAVSAAVATRVQIVGNTILRQDPAPITVKLYNQYGKEMPAPRGAFSITAFNATKGGMLFVEVDAFAVRTAGVAESDIVTVTVMHNASTLVTQANLTAVSASVVNQFALTGIVLPKDQDKVYTTNENVEITYTAYDQYGNTMKITNKDELTIVSSNETILKAVNVAFDDKGKMTFVPEGGAGTVNLSVLVNATGAVSGMPIAVFKPSAPDTIFVVGPTQLVVLEEKANMDYVLYDQFGTVLDNKANKATVEAELKFVSTREDIVHGNDFAIDADGKLSVTPSGNTSGLALVYYYYKGILVDSFQLEVNPVAKPASITNVVAKGAMEFGATQEIPINNIKILDQYGRDFVPATKGLDEDDFKFEASTADFIEPIVPGAKKWTLTAKQTAGSVTYTVTYMVDDAKTDIAAQFTVKVIDVYDAANQVVYTIATIPTLYANAGFDSLAVAKANGYAVEVKLAATEKSGLEVALKQDKIATLTSDHAKIVASRENPWYIYATDAATGKIRAYDDQAKLLASVEVSSSKDQTAKSVSFGADREVWVSQVQGQNIQTAYGVFGLQVKDQYGVNMLATDVPPAYSLMDEGFFTTSNDALKIQYNGVMTTTVVTTPMSVTLTYTTNTGLQDDMTVTIKPDQPVVNQRTSVIYQTIQEAVDEAQENDTLIVGGYVFEENVTIDVDGLSLFSAANAVIDADGGIGIAIEANGVAIEGFEIINAGEYGIFVDQSEDGGYTDMYIAKNTIVGAYYGIYIGNECDGDGHSGSATIIDNVIVDSGEHGIHLHIHGDATGHVFNIIGNYIQGSDGMGIRVFAACNASNVEHVLIHNNTLDQNKVGIRVHVGQNVDLTPEPVIEQVTITNNTVKNSDGEGIRVHAGRYVSGILHVLVANNVVEDSDCHGIRVHLHGDDTLQGTVRIEDNTVINSGSRGIRVHLADGIAMEYVHVLDNVVVGSMANENCEQEYGAEAIRVHAGEDSVIDEVIIDRNQVTQTEAGGIRVHAGVNSEITYVQVWNNRIEDNKGAGIRVSACAWTHVEGAASDSTGVIGQASIIENEIARNKTGVYIYAGRNNWSAVRYGGLVANVTIADNTIEDHEWGVKVVANYNGKVDGVSFMSNTYIDNDVDETIIEEDGGVVVIVHG